MYPTLALLTIVTLSTASADWPNDPSDVSAVEIAAFKTGISMGCRSTGRNRGDPPQQVDRLCACMFAKLEAGLSPDEWRRATFFAQRHQYRELAQILNPKMEATKECSAEQTPGA